MDGDEPLADVS